MPHWTEHDEVSLRLQRSLEHTRSPSLRQTYQRALARRRGSVEHRAAVCGHAPFPLLPPPGCFDGPITLGLRPDGQHFGLTPEELLTLTVVLGQPGSGKSTLLGRLIDTVDAAGRWVLSTDMKGTAEHELAHALPVLDPAEAAMTLDPPPGLAFETWLNRQLTLAESCLWLAYGSELLRRRAMELHERSHPDEQICFAELADAMHMGAARSRNFKEQQHFQSAAMAMDRLHHGNDGLFSSAKMLPWAHRLARSHTLRLDRLGPEAAFMAVLSTLLAYLAVRPAHDRTGRRLHGLAVIDDARPLVRDARGESRPTVNPWQQLYDTAAGRGLGLIVVAQNLSELRRDLLTSAGTVLLVGPVDGTEMRVFRDRFGLSREQEAYLAHQPPYHALCHTRRSDWTHAFPIALPPPVSQQETQARERQRAQRKAELLDGFCAVPWQDQAQAAAAAPRTTPTSAGKGRTRTAAGKTEQGGSAGQRGAPQGRATVAASSAGTKGPPEPSTEKQPAARESQPNPRPPERGPDVQPLDRLEPDVHRLLVQLLDTPTLLQAELGARVGVQGRRLTACRDWLEQHGLIAAHRLVRYTLWEPLEPAAERLGRTHTPLPGRGSYAHRWLQARLAAYLRTIHPTVAVEHPWNGTHLDVFARAQDGTTHAWEIVLTENTLDTAQSKLATFPGPATLIVTDKPAADRAQQHTAPLFAASPPTVSTVKEVVEHSRPA